jgi:hypothetical protein
MASDATNSSRVDSWSSGLGARYSPFGEVVSTEAEALVEIRHQATVSEDIENRACAVVRNKSVRINESVKFTCSYDL